MRCGLCGPSKVGKDTCAKWMEGYQRVAFADPLKRMATMMLRAAGVDCETSDWDIAGFKERWRPLLVAVGAGMRATQPDFWIRKLICDVARRGLGPMDPHVVTDVRYVNEVEWILSKGGVVIRLHRPGYDPVNEEEKRSLEEIAKRFPGLPVVYNHRTPKEMVEEVLKIVAAAEGRRGPVDSRL